MASRKKSYDLGRKYLPSWEKDFSWVKRDTSDPEQPFCKVCRKKLAPRKDSLVQHEKTTTHQGLIKAASSSGTVSFPSTAKVPSSKADKMMTAELELASAVCCHTSINSIDHLGELVKKHGSGSILEHIRLHRTKCSRLIDHVLAPSLKEELSKDLKDSYYSLLADESTDCTVDKHLCLCVTYYSPVAHKIQTVYLGLYAVVETTGEALFRVMEGAVQDVGLSLDRCIGFGSDGAANMIGEHNSVWSRLRERSPHCTLFRCICHSLALCVQKAFDVLPSPLGYIMCEVSAWFSKSTLRREEYKQLSKSADQAALFDVMEEEEGTGDDLEECTDQDGGKKKGGSRPMPFSRPSATRWLVRGKLIKNLLVNWSTLLDYFSNVQRSLGPDVRYKARTISEMLHDDTNYLYFVFLSPIVDEFEKANLYFQATKADPEGMVKELDMLQQALKLRIKDSRGNLLTLPQVDFGARFASESERLKRKQNEKGRLPAFLISLERIRTQCHSFLQALLCQVEKRLPPSKTAFRGLGGLHHSKGLSQVAQLPFDQLPLPNLMADPDLIQTQYRRIGLHPWREEEVFAAGLPREAEEFWSKVLDYQRSDNVKPYRELAQYALAALAVPVSNAVVERVFSHVTYVKSKYRNAMSSSMLDAIIRVRLHLRLQGLCCRDLKITRAMLDKCDSSIYSDNSL